MTRRPVVALPRTVPGLGGPWRVERPRTFDEPTPAHVTCGETIFDRRTIRVRADLDGPTARATLGHELVHAALWDSGVTNLLSAEVEEAVASAVGGVIAALLARSGTPRRRRR